MQESKCAVGLVAFQTPVATPAQNHVNKSDCTLTPRTLYTLVHECANNEVWSTTVASICHVKQDHPCHLKTCPAMSCLQGHPNVARACNRITCHVVYHHVMIRHVVSWRCSPCVVMAVLPIIVSCRVCPVLSCPVLSCPVLSCPVLCCPVLSCPVLFCSVLFCSARLCSPLSWHLE